MLFIVFANSLPNNNGGDMRILSFAINHSLYVCDGSAYSIAAAKILL